jgi:hypothetical protein
MQHSIVDFALDIARAAGLTFFHHLNRWESEAMTETHTCQCPTCGGVTFTAPQGYVPQGRDYAAMVHNYAQMVRNPAMRGVMAARGLVMVEAK